MYKVEEINGKGVWENVCEERRRKMRVRKKSTCNFVLSRLFVIIYSMYASSSGIDAHSTKTKAK